MPAPVSTTRRLSEISTPRGMDVTLRNLLETTRTTLELCGRLSVHEYEARVEGHEAAAVAFGELAAAERAACSDLLRHLRRHLDETLESRDADPPSGPAADLQ